MQFVCKNVRVIKLLDFLAMLMAIRRTNFTPGIFKYESTDYLDALMCAMR